MHEPDFDGRKNEANRANAAWCMKFDLAILLCGVVIYALVVWLGPVIAEVLQ